MFRKYGNFRSELYIILGMFVVFALLTHCDFDNQSEVPEKKSSGKTIVYNCR